MCDDLSATREDTIIRKLWPRIKFLNLSNRDGQLLYIFFANFKDL